VDVTGTIVGDGLTLTTGATVTTVLDEDNMASDSATALSTQQSIKAYVDAQVGTADTLSEVLALGNTTGGTDIAMTGGDKITNFESTGINDDATSTAITIDSSGNVGIGTASPAVKLDVRGSSSALANFSGNNANNYVQMSDNSGTNWASFGSIAGGNWYLYTAGYGALYTGGTERMRIDSAATSVLARQALLGHLQITTN
jgi:hypothetical protein